MFFRERLGPGHDVIGFSCGQTTLDAWLRQAALTADRAGTARTYVWVDGFGEVTAYFALAPFLIRREGLPSAVGRGSPHAIPAILIARLALARRLHGQGLGGALLADALRTALDAIRTAGGRLVVVDAIDEEARAFYEHHGFRPVEGHPHRLVMKASDVARSIGSEWP